MKRTLIGFSMSFCLVDIIRGRVKIDEVVALIVGTNEYSFNELWEHYKVTTWRGLDYEELFALYCLLNEKRIIIRPKANKQEPPNIADGHWMDIVTGVRSKDATSSFQE